MTSTADNTITLDRPDGACLTCPPPSGHRPWRLADPNFMTCSPCFEQLAELLRTIRAGYLRLDPTASGAVFDDGIPTPVGGSKPPLNLTVVCMTDPRSTDTAQEWVGSDNRVHRESDQPILSVPSTLYTLAFFIAGLRGFDDPPVGVGELTYWLSNQLDWISRRAEVAAFHTTLRRLDRQISLVNDGPPDAPAWLLRCPHCRTKLWAPDNDGVISCRPCDKAWPREQWRELGKQARMARLGVGA